MQEEQLKRLEETKRVFCRRCGRELKSKKGKELGFGPSCFAKYIKEQNMSARKRLFVINRQEN